MVALALPEKAQAAGSEKLYLGGVDVIQNPKGTGYSYNATTKTLTLNNYNASGEQAYKCQKAGVYANVFLYSNLDHLTVELKGNNSFKGNKLKYVKESDTSDKNRISMGIVTQSSGQGLTICGDGKLDISVTATPLYINNPTEIKGNTVVNLTSYMDGVRVDGDLLIGTGSKVTMTQTGNELAWTALYMRGRLTVEQGAELNATAAGCKVGINYPAALYVSGSGGVHIHGTVKATSNGQNDYKDGCQGYGIYMSGNLTVYDGGKLEALSEGKGKNNSLTAREAIYIAGGWSLSVAQNGYLKAITNNKEIESNGYQHSAIYASAINTYGDNNNTAVYMRPIYPGISNGQVVDTVYQGTNKYATTVEIRGIRQCSLKLSASYQGSTC